MRIENKQRLLPAGNLRKQNGASLLEGIAYLGIAALVVLGAVSLLSSASASAKANQTTNELVSIRTAVRKLYAGQAYPNSTSLLPILTAANAIPSTLRVNGTVVTNSWGGAVTVTGTTNTTFTIVYNSVPQDVCVSMLSGATDWTNVRQGSGQPKTVTPLTSKDATDICTEPSNNVSLVTN